MAIVEFDIAEFRTAYPKFTTITDPQLQTYAEIAYLFVNNTESSRIPETRRKVLINLMVCHLATLEMRDGDNQFGGQLASAKEGAVSVSYFQYLSTKNSEWYLQTPCGRTYWELMRPYRTGGRYFEFKSICKG